MRSPMIRAFQWDLARQVERLDWLLAQLPRYAAWGYHELYLHLEDVVDYPSLPGVARADAYAWRDLEKLVAAAGRVGLGVVPIVNLLGHTKYLIKTPAWRDLNELRAPDGSPLPVGQICPLHPRTLAVAEKLVHDVAPLCTAGKLHVGLDESFHLGKHPLSRAEITEVGLATHFARYVQRLHAHVAARDLRLGMWADMLVMLPEAIPQLPPDIVAYDWYYHAFAQQPHFELYNFYGYDLATPLRARGIEYWGCPMNGAFRYEPLPTFGERLANITSWWRHTQRVGAAGMLITSWESYRLAQELCTVVDAAAAGLWLNPERGDDHAVLLARGFQRALDLPPAAARAAARTALAGDERAFAGYARWEMHERWDTQAHRTGPAPAEREAAFFRRTLTRPLPEPLAASFAWRGYLAEREEFLRHAARLVLRLRRHRDDPERRTAGLAELATRTTTLALALRSGRRAARTMWCRTRDPARHGQNETILNSDAARLRRWRTWLRAAERDPRRIDTACEVVGRWQLQLTVHNDRPALQCVVVQQQATDGTWHDLARRYTLEFRTAAARPRARIAREWSVPVEDPDLPVRLTLRGVGEVGISHVQLTSGHTTRPNRAWPTRVRQRLGTPAPHSGWVAFDATENRHHLDLAF